MALVIKWNKQAFSQLIKAIEYIQQDSPANADKVKNEILQNIKNLGLHTDKYPADKFKMDNDGSFRAFELYHYRISYRLFKNEVRIIRLRHTKRNPKSY
ncbi:MAG: type II toxin-antitoxin system RelE/ParE family toxin [Sphingobacteriales bacterium]|nr:type II toxin-antitoxin system RelE/ParE family toxin [Sphingobacteriales bacterium]